MPLTTLDENAALITIDLQKGVVGMPLAHPAGEIVARTAALARAFRAARLPVVLVNVASMSPGRVDAPRPDLSAFPADWMELVPELEPQEDNYLITKHRIGAFIGTSLDDILQEQGVTQIIFAGIATSAGVESTARSAYDLGYNVVFAIDAMTDRDEETHRFSVERIFPRLGESCTSETLLAALKAR